MKKFSELVTSYGCAGRFYGNGYPFLLKSPKLDNRLW